jgi:hypothetical protein
MSRIGKKPVILTKGVSASVSGQTVEVKGPKGTRSFTATDDVTLSVVGDEQNTPQRPGAMSTTAGHPLLPRGGGGLHLRAGGGRCRGRLVGHPWGPGP